MTFILQKYDIFITRVPNGTVKGGQRSKGGQRGRICLTEHVKGDVYVRQNMNLA